MNDWSGSLGAFAARTEGRSLREPGQTISVSRELQRAFAARTRLGVRCAHCAHGGQPPEYERSVSYPQNVMTGIALPQNRSKSKPDQPEIDLAFAALTGDSPPNMREAYYLLKM